MLLEIIVSSSLLTGNQFIVEYSLDKSYLDCTAMTSSGSQWKQSTFPDFLFKHVDAIYTTSKL